MLGVSRLKGVRKVAKGGMEVWEVPQVKEGLDRLNSRPRISGTGRFAP
jgi:hypothetical protein